MQSIESSLHSLTVLIPTHGRPTLLERTLDSIAQCKLPESYEELVVIENGSRAGAEELIADLPDRLHARYMHESWGNKSNALNAALETIEDGLVVFFDDDVVVSPNTLVSYATTASQHGSDHFFGGTVQADRERKLPPLIASRFPASVRGYEAEDRVERKGGMIYLGFNWGAYVGDIKKVGGFDPRLGPGSSTGTTVGDESDLQQRMMKNGILPVAVSQAVVTHHVPSEHVTLSWLLQRKYYVGMFLGITTDKDGQDWVSLIKGVLQSFGLLLKGVLIADKERIVIALFSLYQSSGKAKGYLLSDKMKKAI